MAFELEGLQRQQSGWREQFQAEATEGERAASAKQELDSDPKDGHAHTPPLSTLAVSMPPRAVLSPSLLLPVTDLQGSHRGTNEDPPPLPLAGVSQGLNPSQPPESSQNPRDSGVPPPLTKDPPQPPIPSLITT